MPKFGNGLHQGLGLLLDINEERLVTEYLIFDTDQFLHSVYSVYLIVVSFFISSFGIFRIFDTGQFLDFFIRYIPNI